MKSVLILSKLHYGNVPLFAEQLRARGLHSVLVSELGDNRHRDTCDDHVLVDWHSEDLSVLTTRLDQRGIEPVAILNMLESLSAWHLALAAHYDIPGGDESRHVLVSKVLVREHMRALGLSGIRFSSDPAAVDFFLPSSSPHVTPGHRRWSAGWMVRMRCVATSTAWPKPASPTPS